MDASRFDALARAASRRGALRALAGGLAALAVGGRADAAGPGLGLDLIEFGYDRKTNSSVTGYYRSGLLNGAGRFCSADAALVGRTVKFRAECEDYESSTAQSLPILYGVVTLQAGGRSERVVGTCRERAKKYERRIVLRCSVPL